MANILPHEVGLLQDALRASKDNHATVSAMQGEAAGGGSDWHDNSAYDDAVHQTALARGQVQTIEAFLRDAETVDYPGPTEEKIALGSLVRAKDNYGDMPFVIVGQRLTGTDRYVSIWEREEPETIDDFQVVTTASNLGAAALGHIKGETIVFQGNNGKEQRLEVIAIDQGWVPDHFVGQEAATANSDPN